MRRAVCAFACAACASPAPRAKPVDPAPDSFSAADYEQHITALRARLADKGLGHLEIRIEAPFVVVGDGTAAQLEHDASTVRWAADHLEADFFEHRPNKILDVFLFHGAASYEHGVAQL